jgi:hypothetical protein
MTTRVERTPLSRLSLERLFRRKTVRGFADRVATFEDLAQPVRDALRPYLESPAAPSGEALQLILTAPAQTLMGRVAREGRGRPRLLPWGITPNRVLALTGERLLIASSPYVPESPEQERSSDAEYSSEWAAVRALPEVREIPLSQILWLEVGCVLLISWLELTWVHQGELERIRIDFNTVGQDLFADLAARIRIAILADGGIAISGKAQGLELLDDLPFKFRCTIPIHLLLPGEQVLGTAFRPSQWARHMAVFRRHVAPRLAVLRTDGHLIAAREDLTSGRDSYGLIAQFFPLPRLEKVALEDRDGAPELRINLGLDGVEEVLGIPFAVGATVDGSVLAACGGADTSRPASGPART